MTRARDIADLITHEHESALTYVKTTGTTSVGQTTVTGLTYAAGLVDVYLNGIKLVVGTDVTATNGTSITLAAGAAAGWFCCCCSSSCWRWRCCCCCC